MKIHQRSPWKTKLLFPFVIFTVFVFHFLSFTKTDQLKVNVANVVETLKSFEEIADAHGSSRSVVHGHKATLEYLVNRLGEMPSLDLTLQPVMVKVQVDEVAPNFTYKTDNNAVEVTFKPRLQVATSTGSGSCRLSSASLIPYSSCKGNRFDDDVSHVKRGWVALINGASYQDCSPCDRLVSAIENGAHGAVFITQPGNAEGYPHPLPPSPGRCGRNAKYRKHMEKIGIIALSDDAAFTLLNDIAGRKHLIVNLEVVSAFRDYESHNIIATSKAGNSSKIVLFGSHLDSVPAGPGINDDGKKG